MVNCWYKTLSCDADVPNNLHKKYCTFLFYQQIDLWLALYIITIVYITMRTPRGCKPLLFPSKYITKIEKIEIKSQESKTDLVVYMYVYICIAWVHMQHYCCQCWSLSSLSTIKITARWIHLVFIFTFFNKRDYLGLSSFGSGV